MGCPVFVKCKDSFKTIKSDLLLENSIFFQKSDNKYRVLRSYKGYHLNQRVPGGTNRTEEMARISGINQMGPQKLKFQVS